MRTMDLLVSPSDNELVALVGSILFHFGAAIVMHLVQFAVAELQVPGQFIKGEPSVGCHHHRFASGALSKQRVC